MKKTFPVNINGKVFYIDEDAYELLSNYLTQLRAAFCGTEGDEIVTDIESRISEGEPSEHTADHFVVEVSVESLPGRLYN